jgi:hypothetical protein
MAKITAQAVIRKLQALKEADLGGRDIKDVTSLTGVTVITIGKLFTLLEEIAPHNDQRNTQLRLAKKRANHVKTFHIAHTELVVAHYKGKPYLTDGNHRTSAWKLIESMTLPSHLTVIVKVCHTEEEFLSLYECIDSPKSSKSRRDNFFGYCRYHGLEERVSSPLVVEGAMVSAMKRLAGSNSAAAMRAAVGLYREEIVKFDKHQLRPSQIPMGAVLASLKLYKQYPQNDVAVFVEEFVRVWERTGQIQSGAMETVAKDLEQLRDMFGQQLTGERAVDSLAQVLMYAFANAHRPRKHRTIKRTDKVDRGTGPQAATATVSPKNASRTPVPVTALKTVD